MTVKILGLLVGTLMMLSLCGKDAVWSSIPATAGKGTQASIKSESSETFQLTLTPTGENAGKCAIQVVRTWDAPCSAEAQLSFEACSLGGETVEFHLILTCRLADGKIHTYWGPKFRISGKDFSSHVFRLNAALGMKGENHLWQIKPFIGIVKPEKGKAVVVEVRNFRIGMIDEKGTVRQ